MENRFDDLVHRLQVAMDIGHDYVDLAFASPAILHEVFHLQTQRHLIQRQPYNFFHLKKKNEK